MKKSTLPDPFPDLTSYRIWLLSLIGHHQFMILSMIWLLTEFVISEYRFPRGICNGFGMQTGHASSSGHLVQSHFGTYKCLNVETNLSWACLVSGLLSFVIPRYVGFAYIKQITVIPCWLCGCLRHGLITTWLFLIDKLWQHNATAFHLPKIDVIWKNRINLALI